jgi:hypothetical protein
MVILSLRLQATRRIAAAPAYCTHGADHPHHGDRMKSHHRLSQ